MMMNQHKNKKYVIIASLKSETIGKLKYRLPSLFIFISSLPGSPLGTLDELLGKHCDVNKCSQNLAW